MVENNVINHGVKWKCDRSKETKLWFDHGENNTIHFLGLFDSDIQENQRLNPNNVLKGPQKTADKCKESLVDFNNPT